MDTATLPATVRAEVTHCDRCPAAGKMRYEFLNGRDLILCGHHSREHHAKLLLIVLCVEEIN